MVRIINVLEPVYHRDDWVKRKMSYNCYKKKVYHTKLYCALVDNVQDKMLLQDKYYDWSEIMRRVNELSLALKPHSKAIVKEEGEPDSDYSESDENNDIVESGDEYQDRIQQKQKVLIKDDFDAIQETKVKKGKRKRILKKFQKWK